MANPLNSAIGWLGQGIHQATLGYLASRVGAHHGFMARRIRWPFESWEPYRRPVLHTWRAGAIGDVLMCTPTLRRLKEMNPDCHVTFYTHYPALVSGLPFIDDVRLMESVPRNAIQLRYERSFMPTRHLARIMGDELGLDVIDTHPSCSLNIESRSEVLQQISALPRPWIVLSQSAGPWTPNKQWPLENWARLIEKLLKWASVIEIGVAKLSRADSPLWNAERYCDLRGIQSLENLVATLSLADLHVGPPSGPMHIAAAFRVPAVIVIGGYELPTCTEYDGNISLYTQLPCAPCWRRDPCPFDLECLRNIAPVKVEQSLLSLWKSISKSGANKT